MQKQDIDLSLMVDVQWLIGIVIFHHYIVAAALIARMLYHNASWPVIMHHDQRARNAPESNQNQI